MEKRRNNKARIVILSLIGILLAVLVVWLAFHFFSSSNTSKKGTIQIAPTKPIIIPTDEPLVTPTIGPSAKSGWKTFTYSDPATPYSFDYPSSWGLIEIAHDNIVRLNFAGHCKVEFSNNASGENNGIVSQTKQVTYAGRTLQMASSKNKSITVETYTLSNATSKDGFAYVIADIPPSNTFQCQQTVSQILSSIKFGK